MPKIYKRNCDICGKYYTGRGNMYCSRFCFGKGNRIKQIGENGPMFGKKHTSETIEKMKENRRGVNNTMYGKKHSDITKKKISIALSNPSKETRIKIGLCHVGNKNWLGKKHSIDSKIKIGDALRNKKRPLFSDITIKRMSDAQRGEKNNMWKGGITPINKIIRTSKEYNIWRDKVFKRDGYKCQMCPQVGGKLHADHVKPFAYYPELRFDVNNGRTLCVPCHKKTETYGWKAYNWLKRQKLVIIQPVLT